jgi:hypothetical protein
MPLRPADREYAAALSESLPNVISEDPDSVADVRDILGAMRSLPEPVSAPLGTIRRFLAAAGYRPAPDSPGQFRGLSCVLNVNRDRDSAQVR